MASTTLTEKVVRDAKPGRKAVILWDGVIRGLGCKVQGQLKTFVLSYRINGVKRLATLGRCAELSLKAAREKAAKELIAIRDGTSDPLTRRRDARTAPSVDDLWQYFMNEFVPERLALHRLSKKTVKDYKNQMARVLPQLANMKVRTVTKMDVERVVRRLTSTPSLRNRTLALLSRLFTLSEHLGWRAQFSNPCRGVARSREEARDRTLSDSELAALGKALQDLSVQYPAATSAIRFLAVTGWRVSEAIGLQWSYVDMERGVVTLPTTKVGRQTRVLPSAALDVLAGVPRIHGCEAVFTTTGRVSVGYQHMREIFNMACKSAKIEGATMHDLRRGVATAAAASGVGLTVVRDLLGHRTIQMAARYARLSDSALAAAVEQTGSNMATTMGLPDHKVIPIKRKQRHG